MRIDTQKLSKQIAPYAPYFPYVFLVCSVFVAYGNVYGNDFLFDDGLLLTRNEFLLHWSSFGRLLTASTTDGAHIAGGFYRPIQNILYFIIYQLAGFSKFGFHLLNIILHATNVCLLYKLGSKLKFNKTASFLTAFIWGLHPLHTEAVTYMSATADPLYVLFCLLGLIIVLPEFTLNKIIKVLPIFILGLLSKESAVVFPALVVCCMFMTSKDPLKSKIYFSTWPLWILTIVYLSWRLTATDLDGPTTYARIFQEHDYYNLKIYSQDITIRFATFLATLPSYLSLIVWPQGLHMERDFMIYATYSSNAVIEGIVLLLLALTQVIFNSKKSGKPLSFGLLWFATVHFPDTGLLIPTNSLFLEHWMYLPTAGLFLGSAQTIYAYADKVKFPQFKTGVAALAFLSGSALGFCTFIQNNVWHDPITFYSHLFKYGAVSARAHNNMALAYMERHDYAKAFQEYKNAIATTDTYAETRYNLAVSLLNLPDADKHVSEAITNLERSLEIDPHFYRSYAALAKIYEHIGDHDKAVFFNEKADETLRTYHP